VEIDRVTYEKYQTVPDGPLRVLIDQNVLRTPENAGESNLTAAGSSRPAAFAFIQMPTSLVCPMLNAQKLCQIQVELGEGYLSETCSTYPRTIHMINQVRETTLTLSCPEAVRVVLTSPGLVDQSAGEIRYHGWDDRPAVPEELRSYFWPMREFTCSLIRNRAYPLWQRMFLLGTFCRRLEAVLRGEVEGGFPAVEAGFSKAIATGSLRASIETIPADNRLQLDMVAELIRLPVPGGVRSPRFAECVDAFIEGISQGEGAGLEGQIAEYGVAYERFYAPFFLEHPHMLENYIENMMLSKLFPFGAAALRNPDAVLEPAKEYALLATEFALIKGLLIGVSGFHREAFAVEHVVHTIQSAFKNFQHNVQFVPWSLQQLTAKKLDNAHGLTMLLRN